MIRMRTKTTEMAPKNGALEGPELVDWELRPGGMLVQKRGPDSDKSSLPVPAIRVKVKYGSSYHDVYINSQATFGELKKLLAETTGLHPQDQKLLFKDKERDSNAYLDIVGVKDRSKIVLVQDPTSQERRYVEMRKNAKMEKASKSISAISLEVDRLAGQVSALESVICNGGKVAETDVLNLTELLMNQLIKLDGIFADGDVKLQRRMQVNRVQKYVETLDLLKIRNAMPDSNGNHVPMQQEQKHARGQVPISIQQQQQRQSNGLMPKMPIELQQQRNPTGQMPRMSVELQQQRNSSGQMPVTIPVQHEQQWNSGLAQTMSPSLQNLQQQPAKHSASGPVVVTTKWETFDLVSAQIPAPSTSTQTPPKSTWEFFD